MNWTRQPLATLITATTHEPVDLAEAKLFLRVDDWADDTLIESLITASRLWVEAYTRRTLCHETYDFRYRDFPQLGAPLIVPKAPLASVTSITYLDANGTAQTWSTDRYVVRALAGPMAGRGSIEVTSATEYPAVSSEAAYPVIVRAVAGYGANASSVPAGIKAAVSLLLGDLYTNRQETVIGTSTARIQTTVERLLAPYRLPEVP